MNTKLRRGLMLLLLLVLAVSLGMSGRKQLQYRQNAKSRDVALQLARFQEPSSGVPGTDPVQSLTALDLSALQEANPDVCGWITIPDTELSYPLLRGPDNDFYLYRGWDKVRNDCGSIFLDYRCSSDFEDFHTIVYGHRMRNDSMFGTLKYYQEQDFWQAHPSIYVVLADRILRYDIFSAQEPSIEGIVYRLDVEENHLEEEFLQFCLENSVLDTGLTPEPSDRILTLSTCTGNGHSTRWTVHSYLAEVYDLEHQAQGAAVQDNEQVLHR